LERKINGSGDRKLKPSQILAQFETDEKNRTVVYKRVGAAVNLPDDVAELYEVQRIAMATQLPDAAAEIAAALFVTCRKHLILGMTALFRCFSSQAFRETRGAIEAAGIAGLIRQSEEAFRLFREDNDAVSRKAARKYFTSGNMFVGELAGLKKLYDDASERSHTNRRSLVRNIRLPQAGFSFQDIRNEDIPHLFKNHLIWICGAHIKILEAADTVFPEGKGELIDKFLKERQRIGEKIWRFMEGNKEDMEAAKNGSNQHQ
jgi:hypothetical protein